MESVVIIIDNSESSINGDYFPNRFEAQRDAARLIFDKKLRSNVENSVGLMMMAGKDPKIVVTPTGDKTTFESSLLSKECHPDSDSLNFLRAIEISLLALKYRQNKAQAQRIILFFGCYTPNIASAQAKLGEGIAKLGKKMKKNSIALDVVVFGDIDQILPIATNLVQTVNSSENSRVVIVPPRQNIKEFLVKPQGLFNSSNSTSTASNNDEMVGMDGLDEELDPELAMAIRLSLEEQQNNNPTENPIASAPLESNETFQTEPANSANNENIDAMDEVEDEELMRAIAMSLEEHHQNDETPQDNNQSNK